MGGRREDKGGDISGGEPRYYMYGPRRPERKEGGTILRKRSSDMGKQLTEVGTFMRQWEWNRGVRFITYGRAKD